MFKDLSQYRWALKVWDRSEEIMETLNEDETSDDMTKRDMAISLALQEEGVAPMGEMIDLIIDCHLMEEALKDEEEAMRDISPVKAILWWLGIDDE